MVYSGWCEQFIKNMYETSGVGITNLVAVIDEKDDKIAKLTETVESKQQVGRL
mgnify:CR=1 FL=1